MVLAGFGIEAKTIDERQYDALRTEITSIYELLSGLAFKGYPRAENTPAFRLVMTGRLGYSLVYSG